MVTDMTWQEFSSLYYKQVVEMAHKYLHKMKSQSGFGTDALMKIFFVRMQQLMLLKADTINLILIEGRLT